MTRVLETNDLTAGYAGSPVVRNLSMHVDAGEVVALLGANGAGKTTTLLSVCGLIKPMGGRVCIAGRPTRGTAPHLLARRGLAFVPEDRSLFPSLTVAENLRLGSRRGSGSGERALAWFPALRPLRDRPAGLLSGGEQQMLTLGRALASDPSLLLVDELSLGLAPVVVQQLMPILRQVADDSGCGVLLVEQHVHLALDVADRVYVLSRGSLALSAAAAKLRENPRLVEASYLGRASAQADPVTPRADH